MGIRFILNTSLTYGRYVLCGVPESGGTDSSGEGGSCPAPTLGPSHVLGKMLGSVHAHPGAGSHWAMFKSQQILS